MFCSSCGSLQADDARFCGECGERFTARTTSAASPIWKSVEIGRGDNGDSFIEVEAAATCQEVSAHLVRLRWMAVDEVSGQYLTHGHTDLIEDFDDGDPVELTERRFFQAPQGGRIRVSGQVIIFGGPTANVVVQPFPDVAQPRRGSTILPNSPVTIQWFGHTLDADDDKASCAVAIAAVNSGGSPLPALSFRIRIKGRKGDGFVTEWLVIEGLLAGETRVVDTTLEIEEPARKRAGAVLEVSAVVCSAPKVLPLPETVSDGSATSPARPAARNLTGPGGTRTQRFYGNMDWFDVAEQPDDFAALPDAFRTAARLWNSDPEGNSDKVIAMLSPFVRARFVACAIDNWEELFADPEGEGMPEFEASHVRVAGIDFSSGPIPKCKAEAEFDVPVTDAFSVEMLDEWEEINSPLYQAISFRWDIPESGRLEGLDLTAGDNSGVECIPLS